MNYKLLLVLLFLLVFFGMLPDRVHCGMNCSIGQFWDGNTNACENCDIRCYDCDDIGCTKCLKSHHRQLIANNCQPKAGYYENNASIASRCDYPMRCQLCSGPAQCDVCLSYNYLSSFDQLCHGCFPQSPTCLNYTYSLSCDQTYGLHYIGSSIQICLLCTKYDSHCHLCTAVKECQECQNPYVVDTRVYPYACIICQDQIINCTKCSIGPACQTCLSGCYLDSNTCIPCSQYQCATCSSVSICESCYPYFQILNDDCTQICGDGVAIDLICDILPLRQYDGCTETCTEQPQFTCNINGNHNICSYSGKFDFTINKITKSTFLNQITLQVSYEPALTIFLDDPQKFLFPFLFLIDKNNDNLEISCSKSSENSFIITVNNARSLQDENITIFYDPTLSSYGELLYNIQQSNTFKMIPTNSYAYYYSQTQYAICQVYNYFSIVLSAITLLLFFVEIFSRNMVALQLILILQFGYASLVWYRTKYLMPPYMCIVPLWISNGYNYNYQLPFRSETFSTYTVEQTQYLSSNYNIVLFLIILIPLTWKIMTVIFKYLPCEKLRQIGQQQSDLFYQLGLICQLFAYTQFINDLVLFYGTPFVTTTLDLKDIPSNIVTIIALIIFLIVFIYYLIRPSSFGKFNTAFCLTILSKRTYLITVVVLSILIILMRFLQGYSLLAPLFISMSLFIYMIAYRPYFSIMNNILSGMTYIGYPLFISLRIFFQLYDGTQDPNSSNKRLPQFIFVGILLGYLFMLSIFVLLHIVYQFVDRYYIQPKMKQKLVFQLFDKDTSYKRGMQELLEMKKYLKCQQSEQKKGALSFIKDPMFQYKKINIPKLFKNNKKNQQEAEQEIPQSIRNEQDLENSVKELKIQCEENSESKNKHNLSPPSINRILNRPVISKQMETILEEQNQIIRFQDVKLFINKYGTSVDPQVLKQFDEL